MLTCHAGRGQLKVLAGLGQVLRQALGSVQVGHAQFVVHGADGQLVVMGLPWRLPLVFLARSMPEAKRTWPSWLGQPCANLGSLSVRVCRGCHQYLVCGGAILIVTRDIR